MLYNHALLLASRTALTSGEQRGKSNGSCDLPSWDYSSTNQKDRFPLQIFVLPAGSSSHCCCHLTTGLLLPPHHRIAFGLRCERLEKKTKRHFHTLCFRSSLYNSWVRARVLLPECSLSAPQYSFLFWTSLTWDWRGKNGKLITDSGLLSLSICYYLLFRDIK